MIFNEKILYLTQLLRYESLLVFLVGLLIGSFLNVCIYRIPLGNFWKSQRSFCPHCQKGIPFYHNLPIISFLFLRGKSACCEKKISWQYPAVELLTGVLWLVCFMKYPFFQFSLSGLNYYPLESFRFFFTAFFFSLLTICSFIDLKLFIIPDVISLPMIAIAPILAVFHPEHGIINSLIGVALGAFLIYAIAWIYYLLRGQEGIGMGDAKLLAAIGGWLGWQSVLPTLTYGAILGSVIGIISLLFRKNKSLQAEVPFGPFLALGAVVYFFHNSDYLRIF